MGRPKRNGINNDLLLVAKEEKKMWHVAVYIRLSKEDGNVESESVVNQKKIILEYLENNCEERHTIVDFYIDDGLSGTDTMRASFMRMVHDIENGRVNCVICKTLARAFRNYSDQGYYLEYYFIKKNVRFISIGDPYIDTFKNPETINGLEVPITGLMNDRFAQRTSDDIRRTLDMKRRRGEYIGAFGPYGYLKDPNDKTKLIIDNDVVSIKRDMLHWILYNNMSLQGVAHKLNEMGIPNPTKYKQSKGFNYYNPNSVNNDGLWTGIVVKMILLDKVNLGHMVQGKYRVVSYKIHDRVRVPEDEWFIVHNTHEPTFTQEEYDKLENLLKRSTNKSNHSKQVRHFAGFLRCADCNSGMQRSPVKQYVYFSCRTFRVKSKHLCTKHTIREDVLTEAVLSDIRMQIDLIENLAGNIENINSVANAKAKLVQFKTLLHDRRNELNKMTDDMDNLYIDWKFGDITEDEYIRMRERYKQQVTQLKGLVYEIEKEQTLASNEITLNSPLFTQFLRYKNIKELDRIVLGDLVDTIFIHEDKKISIKFKFEDQLELALNLVSKAKS